MTKSTLISITLVAAAVAAAIGYQTLTSGPDTASNSKAQEVTPSQATPSESSMQAQPLTASQAVAKPVAPVSMNAPIAATQVEHIEQQVQADMASTQMPASTMERDRKPASINDPSHPPRQAPNANQAPRSAPNANPEYAHHPRPGTEQPVSAPVSNMPPQRTGN